MIHDFHSVQINANSGFLIYLECVNFAFDSVRALKGERGKDHEIFAPVGVTITTDDGRVLGIYCVYFN